MPSTFSLRRLLHSLNIFRAFDATRKYANEGHPLRPHGSAGSFYDDWIAARQLDGSGNTASTFVGRIHFSSTDAQAILPRDYTFTAADGGVATFTVTLQTAGSQQLQVRSFGTPSFHAVDLTTLTRLAVRDDGLPITGDY